MIRRSSRSRSRLAGLAGPPGGLDVAALRRQLGLELRAPKSGLALSALVPLSSLLGEPGGTARLLARLIELAAGLAAADVGLVVLGPRSRQGLLGLLEISLGALLGLLALTEARGELLPFRARRQGGIGALPRQQPQLSGGAVVARRRPR